VFIFFPNLIYETIACVCPSHYVNRLVLYKRPQRLSAYSVFVPNLFLGLYEERKKKKPGLVLVVGKGKKGKKCFLSHQQEIESFSWENGLLMGIRKRDGNWN
jgi:hypothetical protein